VSDIDAIKTCLNEWLEGLDSGDLERMIATCDPEIKVCNERQPTKIGVQAIRDIYGPRIEATTFKSSFEIENLDVYDGFAVLIGRFSVEATDKATGQQGGGQGRLVLVYRRHADGTWKMLLDINNNDDRDAA